MSAMSKSRLTTNNSTLSNLLVCLSLDDKGTVGQESHFDEQTVSKLTRTYCC